MKSSNRRTFIKKSVLMGIGSTYMMSSGNVWAFSPNETVNIAIIGTGGRSYALAKGLSFCQNINLTHACDVDENQLKKFLQYCAENLDYKPKPEKDFRNILKEKNVDAIVIATPEHWHAPMAIMGMQADKHVYVEKPCSHNVYENELLVQAHQKYNKVCQMGNQQRSSTTSLQAIKDIRAGKIGEVYAAKAWYANTRGSIGYGKTVSVPDTLDWDLWQGPAPREAYRDNVHPYNWHWFRNWGTGEIHNNGTHEIDICRWALGVDYPKRVVSTGGRLHYEDNWEFFDTQIANFEFDGHKTITWEGRSCNGMNLYERGRGALMHGKEGSILLDRSGYQLMDLNGNLIAYLSEESLRSATSTSDTSGFGGLTVKHLQNFIDAIREGKKLNAPIQDASISTHLCHLGNIAMDLEVSVEVDSSTGKIRDNEKALALTKRKYEKGWEPKV